MNPVPSRIPRRRLTPRLFVASLCAALTGALFAGPAALPSAQAASAVTVVVQTVPGSGEAVEQAVERLGGHVDVALPIIDGFAATIPAERVDALQAAPGVTAVTPNREVAFTGQYGEGSGEASAVYTDVVRASATWERGYTGQGVGVAVIDTGINPVGDLAGSLVGGVDLTSEANNVDSFGHGTFIAGLIAGSGSGSNGAVKGVAPGVKLISVKIAGADGSTDLVRLIAALDFVATTRDVFGTRVVNLSLSVAPLAPSQRDPIDIAVERVWHSGVVVVTAAGNKGNTAGGITSPGDDPFVITAGASDDRTTLQNGDDTLASFSSVGPTADGFAKPDLVAPGKSVVSVRAAGSTIDRTNPGARIGTQYFKGSGTSFSAALTSGSAALVLSRTPALTPNQVKARLVGTARGAGNIIPAAGRGAGVLDAEAATTSSDTSAANAGLTPGSLLGVSGNDVIPAGSSWGGSSWGGSSWGGSSWGGSSWGGSSWGGSSWAGSSWAGSSWAGSSWAAASWDGR
ncbi:MAG TPA: S8 family peptidase [Acidimicrobiia bacterium]|nr:S8 family peptidase [Acidimicrobiia bacterium]